MASDFTIVVFDRIRENVVRHRGMPYESIVNHSIVQTLARSINTSMTVVVTLIIIIFVGSATPDLKFFNVAMLFGIISGTYSSIYNASPILYVYDRYLAKTKGEAATLMGVASHELAKHRTMALRADGEKRDTGAKSQEPGYGQVKRRRASAVQRSRQEIDEE